MKIFYLLLLIILTSILELKSEWEELEPFSSRLGAEYFNLNSDTAFALNYQGYVNIKSKDNKFFHKINERYLDTAGWVYNYFVYKNKITLSMGVTFSYVKDTVINNNDGGIYQSTDYGKTWKLFNNINKSIHSWGYFENDDYIYYSCEDGFNIINKSNNNSRKINSYEKVGDTIKFNSRRFAVNQQNNENVILTNNYGKILLLDSPDSDFYEIFPPAGFKMIKPFIYLQFNGDTILGISEDQIIYSLNKGKNWTISDISGRKDLINAVIFNNYVFVSTKKGQIYRKPISSGFWTPVFDDQYQFNLTLFVKDNKLHFYGAETYFTTDNGESWEVIDLFRKSYYSAFQVQDGNLYLPTQENFIYKTNDTKNIKWESVNDSLSKVLKLYNLIAAKDSIIFAIQSTFQNAVLSTDNGSTWKQVYFDDLANLNYCFIYDNKLFAGSRSFGKYYVSDDLGENWQMREILTKDSIPLTIHINEVYVFDGILYAATIGNGIFSSTDSGETWEKITVDINDPMYSGSINMLANYHSNFIAVTTNQKLMKSIDKGNSWKELNFEYTHDKIMSITNYRNNYFITTDQGFYYSTDIGETWTKYNYGLSEKVFWNWRLRLGVYITAYKDYIFLFYNDLIYQLPLSDLGVEYTSVENTEKRNYLYLNPAYPQPANNIVNIKTYWDSALPITTDDISVYNINGIEVKVSDMKITKETNYSGIVTIDGSDLEPGVYFVKISHGTESRVSKILIE